MNDTDVSRSDSTSVSSSIQGDILVVDDTLPNLRALSAMLTEQGYKVRGARDGPTALMIAEGKPPDLILLDIRMPGMDGYQVCRQLKGQAETRDIPVIFISALDEVTDKVKGFEAGGVDYITKPFQLEEVSARVQAHLSLRDLQRQLEVRNAQLQSEVAERKRAERGQKEALAETLQATRALQKAHDELEQRVEERTAELAQANVSLKAEMAERKQAEVERERLIVQIQEQAQRVQHIVDTVPEGVLLLDADERIVLVNPLGEKELAALAGVKVGDSLIHLGNRPLIELLTSPPKGLWHELAADGRYFQVIARPMEIGPEPGGWVLVIHDVTKARQVREQLQRQERLAAVGQLAAGIAHDFNNIMAVIVLYSQMAARAEGVPARVQERMGTINQQAQHATGLIRQILDFSRQSVLERKPLDLLLTVKEQCKLLERTLPENIEIDLDCGPDDYTVNADPTRMQQMFTNLAVNARDAMPGGGGLRIALERIEILPGKSPRSLDMEVGEWMQITVSDTGTGIPADVLPRIFDPFFTTKEPGAGTGLGLAQVHGIVGAHDGHIDVDTWPGKGTTFIIYLPAMLAHPVEQSVPELDLCEGRGETLLVVEDEAAVRDALVESLQTMNYQVLEAADGQEALEILEQHGDQVALVLSDLVMPKMGGQALFYAMRQRGLTTPVLMLSGHPVVGELENLRAQGLAGWMLKPPSLAPLARLLAQVLSGDAV